MPELPEVETTLRTIEPYLTGQVVIQLTIRQPQLRWPIPTSINDLVGQSIQAITRRAKYLIIHCSNGTLIMHLGMSGSLRLLNKLSPARKHEHVDILLSNGYCLRFNDPRRFGAVLWLAQSAWEEHPLLTHLGPEPLSEKFNADYLYTLSRKRKIAIKPFIMDNHVVVGIGNIYASEALFLAKIHPNRATNRISYERYVILVENIKQVLQAAIQLGGTTLRDFTQGNGELGYFKQQLLVYGRANQPCKLCTTQLKLLRLGQRSSVYCPQCQR